MVIQETWRSDTAFCQAAKLLWPLDFDLAWHYRRKRGKADAIRRMEDRFQGWQALVSLARLAESATHAANHLRGSTGLR